MSWLAYSLFYRSPLYQFVFCFSLRCPLCYSQGRHIIYLGSLICLKIAFWLIFKTPSSLMIAWEVECQLYQKMFHDLYLGAKKIIMKSSPCRLASGAFDLVLCRSCEWLQTPVLFSVLNLRKKCLSSWSEKEKKKDQTYKVKDLYYKLIKIKWQLQENVK